MDIIELCVAIEEFAEMMTYDQEYERRAGDNSKSCLLANLIEEFSEIRRSAKEIYEIFEKRA